MLNWVSTYGIKNRLYISAETYVQVFSMNWIKPILVVWAKNNNILNFYYNGKDFQFDVFKNIEGLLQDSV